MDKKYDIVIIGGGPAGMTAGLYSARARMKALLLEKAMCGGQVLITDKIENFPGFPDGVSGPDLAEWMLKQAQRFGLEVEAFDAASIVLKDSSADDFVVRSGDGAEIRATALVIATGAKWNKLGIPGEGEYAGRGVSYCATCDGPLFRGKEVMVIGGGDTALEDALFLTKFAKNVTIVHRRDRLRATKILQERAYGNDRISFRFNSVAARISGDNVVRQVKIRDVSTGKEDMLRCDGVFVLIGVSPNSDIVKGSLDLDESGYIISDNEMRTSVEGIYACGDVRKKSLRQVVTATGEGAVAAFSAEHYVDRLRGQEYKEYK